MPAVSRAAAHAAQAPKLVVEGMRSNKVTVIMMCPGPVSHTTVVVVAAVVAELSEFRSYTQSAGRGC